MDNSLGVVRLLFGGRGRSQDPSFFALMVGTSCNFGQAAKLIRICKNA